MYLVPTAVVWDSGTSKQLSPTTLNRLGKSEEFLESVLADHPELLGIQTRRTGIRGPFAVFRQVPLPTPAGREIYPDIVLLSTSGHFIVVEVKLGRNPELKDRRVIAQIIDYAASFSALSEEQLLRVFGITSGLWAEFVRDCFPNEDNIEELSELLLERANTGALNLVIASDNIPPGVPEVISGISSQHTTAFDLDLVEVLPFVDPTNSDNQKIYFVPTTRLSTEIVARTTVTVTYQQGTVRPETEVETDTPEEIEKRTKEVTKKTSPARVWPPDEVEEVFRQKGDTGDIQLLDFVKEHSADGEFVSPGTKIAASFGFYVRGIRADGKNVRNMFFCYNYDWEHMTIFLNMMSAIVDIDVSKKLRSRLKACLGEAIKIEQKEPLVAVTAVHDKLDEFKDLVLWFQQQAAHQLSEKERNTSAR